MSNDAELTWMLELNRLGIEAGLSGFPMQPEVMQAGNCCSQDFEKGFTPREAIDNMKRWYKENFPEMVAG